MRVNINHTLLMVLTSFFKVSVHLSRRKFDSETRIYIYSDVMCYFPVFSYLEDIKAALNCKPFTVSNGYSSVCLQVSSRLPSSIKSKYSTFYFLREYSSSTLWGTIRSLSLQMAFAARFSEVTTDITHIS